MGTSEDAGGARDSPRPAAGTGPAYAGKAVRPGRAVRARGHEVIPRDWSAPRALRGPAAPSGRRPGLCGGFALRPDAASYESARAERDWLLERAKTPLAAARSLSAPRLDTLGREWIAGRQLN